VITLVDVIRSRNFIHSSAFLIMWTFLLTGCGGGGTSGPEPKDPDLLYQESFTHAPDGGLPTGWSLITQEAATEDRPAHWRVKSGILHQSSNVRAPATPGLPFAMNYEGTMAIVGDPDWANITYHAELTPHDNDGIGIVFRWQPSDVDGDGNFYRFLIVNDQTSGGPRARVDKRINGVWTILGEEISTQYEHRENRSYTVEVEMVLSEFTIKLNDTTLFQFSDASIPNGQIGFFCYAEEGADFDNIRVYRRGP